MAKTEMDEVNLLDLLASILRTLRKNLLITFLFPIVGIVLGLMWAMQSKSAFQASLLLETSLISQSECKFLLDQAYQAGPLPGLTKGQSDQLTKFKYEVTNNANINELNEKSIFVEITARVRDKSLFPAVEKAVIDLINTSPSVVRHRAERDRMYGEMITKIEDELAAMEEVKKNIPGSVQATYLNPADLYATTFQLQKEKSRYELRRNEIKSIHVVNGFESFTVDARMSKMMGGIIGFVVGSLLLCVVLFAKYFSRYVSDSETTR